jgi:hypothetical protein
MRFPSKATNQGLGAHPNYLSLLNKDTEFIIKIYLMSKAISENFMIDHEVPDLQE